MPNYAWSALDITCKDEHTGELESLASRLNVLSEMKFLRNALHKYLFLAEAGVIGCIRDVEFPARPEVAQNCSKKLRTMPSNVFVTELLEKLKAGDLADPEFYLFVTRGLLQNDDLDLKRYAWNGPLLKKSHKVILEPLLKAHYQFSLRHGDRPAKELWDELCYRASPKPTLTLSQPDLTVEMLNPKPAISLLTGFNGHYLKTRDGTSDSLDKEELPYSEYHHNCELYDTKWPTFLATVESSSPQCLQLSFQTAWSEPLEAFKVASKSLPNLTFEFQTMYEADLSVCQYTIEAGEVSETIIDSVRCLDLTYSDSEFTPEEKKKLLHEFLDEEKVLSSDCALIRVPEWMLGSALMKEVF